MTDIVEHLSLDFRTRHRAFADRLMADLERTSPVVARILSEALEHRCTPGIHIEAEHICLDLGAIPESDFDSIFPLRLRERLDEALVTLTMAGKDEGIRKTDNDDHALELLTGFLLHGVLCVDRLTGFGGTPAALFMHVARHRGAELARLLRRYGHYAGLQERLVQQLDDPELEAGVRTLTPADAGFICDYTHLLRQKHHDARRRDITGRQYRDTVWRVIYAWLLNDRGSAFNRKRFLENTIASIAAKLNTRTRNLLETLCEGIGRMRRRQSQLPELLSLLDLIRSETAHREKQRLASATERLRQTLIIAIRKKEAVAGPEWLPLLKNMLSRDTSAWPLLQGLSEPETQWLVAAIVPRQAGFVLGYAKVLDRHRERGLFEGKTGGGFGVVKWVAIFVALLENPGAGFDRTRFVEHTLRRLAARHNLAMRDLLRILTQERHLALIDRRLPAIFLELTAKYSPGPTARNTAEDMCEQVGNRLKNPDTKLSDTSASKIVAFFSHRDRCRDWLRAHREKDCRRLVGILVPRDAAFLCDYAGRLGAMERDFVPAGRGNGAFARAKWEFILLTLAGRNGHPPTRKHMIGHSLRGLAAHYNLAYVELLLYFTRDDEGLPPPLRETFDRLLHDELRATKMAAGRDAGRHAEDVIRRLAAGDDMARQRLDRAFRSIWQEWTDIRRLTAGGYFDTRGFVREALLRIGRLHGIDRTRVEQAMRQPKKTAPPLPAKPAGQSIALRIENAGVVILAPYMPRLFDMAGLLKDGCLGDAQARTRAIFLLQYILYGDRRTSFAEHELTLCKLLAGCPPDESQPTWRELPEPQKTLAGSLLQGVISNWEKLKNTSPQTLRETFLVRPGLLAEHADHHLLTVEERACDLLLDTIPWNFRTMRFPWMNKHIEVKWR